MILARVFESYVYCLQSSIVRANYVITRQVSRRYTVSIIAATAGGATFKGAPTVPRSTCRTLIVTWLPDLYRTL